MKPRLLPAIVTALCLGVACSSPAPSARRVKMKYEVRNGVPVIVRLAEIDLVDDKAGKPIGIQQVTGAGWSWI